MRPKINLWLLSTISIVSGTDRLIVQNPTFVSDVDQLQSLALEKLQSHSAVFEHLGPNLGILVVLALVDLLPTRDDLHQVDEEESIGPAMVSVVLGAHLQILSEITD